MQSFDAKALTVTLAGVRIEGWADTDPLAVEWNEDRYKIKVGADGETARARVNNLSGTIMLKLMPASAANSALDALSRADDVANLGVVPFAITDPSSGEAFLSAGVWVKKKPPLTFGIEVKEREWLLEFANGETIHGASLLPV